jgi:hypothetical protein
VIFCDLRGENSFYQHFMTKILTEPELETWDLIIEPRKKWYDLQFRDLWHYRALNKSNY